MILAAKWLGVAPWELQNRPGELQRAWGMMTAQAKGERRAQIRRDILEKAQASARNRR